LTFEELEHVQLIMCCQLTLSSVVNKYVQFVKYNYLLFLFYICCIRTVNVRSQVICLLADEVM